MKYTVSIERCDVDPSLSQKDDLRKIDLEDEQRAVTEEDCGP